MANLEWASELASDLIGDYGASVSISLFFPGQAQNPWEEAKPVERVFDSLTGLFTRFEEKAIDGTRIKESDRRVLIPGFDLGEQSFETWLNGHLVVYKEDSPWKTWQIVGISQIAPDENTVIYVLHVRK